MSTDSHLTEVYLLLQNGKLPQAKAEIRRILADASNSPLDRANLCMNTANLLQRTRDFEGVADPESLYKEAIDLYSSLVPRPNRELANAEMGLGVYYKNCRQIEFAVDFLSRAKSQYTELLKTNNNETLIDIAKVNFNLANLYITTGRLQEAFRKLLVSQYILVNFYPLAKELFETVSDQLKRVTDVLGEEVADAPSSFLMASYDSWFNKFPELNLVLETEAYEPTPVNETIVSGKLALLTGAGASKALGFATMVDFVDHIKKKLPGIQKYVKTDTKDLEDVLRTLLESWYRERQRLFKEKKSKDVSELYDLIVQVKSLICEYYCKTPSTEEVVALYKPLITFLWQFTSFLPIFTFNYDRSIECFARAEEVYLISGFPCSRKESRSDNDLIWDPIEFLNYVRKEGEREIILFKLHGSVTWRYNYMVGEFIQIDAEMPRAAMPGYGDNLIYPIQPKISLFNPVLQVLDSYFCESIKHLNVLIAIGYSFRDAHVRKKLIRAKQLNPKLTVIVIDPHATNVTEIFKEMGFTVGSDFFPIETKFAPGSELSKSLEPLILKLIERNKL